MAARNCATPPNIAANGNRYWPDFASPYQPARCADTMNVAAANPNSPRIEGGAIGWSMTRIRSSMAGAVAPGCALVRAKRCSSLRVVAMSILLRYGVALCRRVARAPGPPREECRVDDGLAARET